ncbi:MAG: multiheme c-type cytochrome [Pirellulaceae bacterium]
MVSEWMLIVILVAGALLPITGFWIRRPELQHRWSMLLVGVWILSPVACLLAVFTYCGRPVQIDDLPADRPVQMVADDYIGSNTCLTCHPQEHGSWQQSYHRGMTQVVSPQTVLTDFQDEAGYDKVLTTLDGRDYVIGRRDDQYLVTLTPRGFRTVTRPLVMSTGSHHMQLYWYSTGQTRLLGMLPFVYLIEDQRWIPRDAAFLGLSGPSSDELQRWNSTCIRCHTTHPRSRVFSGTNVDSQAAEFGISCEACHGPGAEHVRANRNPLHRFGNYLSQEADDTIVNPLRVDHQRGSAICGLCHAVSSALSLEDATSWREHGYKFRPGDDLQQHRHLLHPTRLDDPITKDTLKRDEEFFDHTFWKDGVVRVNGREYSALMENPCFQRGKMSCFSCHSMHQKADDPRSAKEWADDQLKPLMRTNQACIQCHKQYREPAKIKAHTHHLADSAGSQCMNCHMPMTAYGLLKATRSHQIEIPDVSTSLATGRPNACNQCHLDQSLGWAADHLKSWYGTERPREMSEQQETVSAALLWLLQGDAGQRALMAWSLSWPPAREVSQTDQWAPPFLLQLMQDPYPAVRYIAARSLKALPDYGNMDYDFLSDQPQATAEGEKLLSLWQQRTKKTQLQGRRQLLMDEQGNLDRAWFERLLKDRDDRRVFLAE